MDDRPRGWIQYVTSRHGRVGQTVRLAGPPEAKEVIDWPQREDASGPLVRVKVLKSEAGHFVTHEPGDVIEVARDYAQPRLRDGRMRLARPDEPLTSERE